jgi:hypothetical protein
MNPVMCCWGPVSIGGRFTTYAPLYTLHLKEEEFKQRLVAEGRAEIPSLVMS